METAFVFRDLWGGLLVQLTAMLRAQIADGTLMLPVEAVAYHDGTELLSIKLDKEGIIKSMQCREVRVAMFPLTATISAANGKRDWTISVP
jgi:hypothetical protein